MLICQSFDTTFPFLIVSGGIIHLMKALTLLKDKSFLLYPFQVFIFKIAVNKAAVTHLTLIHNGTIYYINQMTNYCCEGIKAH